VHGLAAVDGFGQRLMDALTHLLCGDELDILASACDVACAIACLEYSVNCQFDSASILFKIC
jgi:hypothetical protein